MELDFNIKSCTINITKHFRTKYMEKWSMRQEQVRTAITEAYRVEKVGRHKYEAYFRSSGKSKKIIFAYDRFFDEISIISGAQGK